MDFFSSKSRVLLIRLSSSAHRYQLGGTITGEHGDGLARTKYIESVYGPRIYYLFKEIKKLFDPRCIMNVGKKVIQPRN